MREATNCPNIQMFEIEQRFILTLVLARLVEDGLSSGELGSFDLFLKSEFIYIHLSHVNFNV